MQKEINTLGLRCPEPLMIVRRELRSLESGDSLVISADDPSTERDFTLLCTHFGYTLLKNDITNTQILSFTITKS